MWSSDLPLVKQEKPMVYPSPEPSLYSKPSKLWGQPMGAPVRIFLRVLAVTVSASSRQMRRTFFRLR